MTIERLQERYDNQILDIQTEIAHLTAMKAEHLKNNNEWGFNLCRFEIEKLSATQSAYIQFVNDLDNITAEVQG